MINPLGLTIAIVGHLLNGTVSIFDKFLLTKTFRHPASYTFWVGLLSLGTLVLLSFGFAWPTPYQWLIDLSAGATFVLALYFFYYAIRWSEVSRVIPIVGALTPVITLFLAQISLGEIFTGSQIWAIIILIIGIVVLTYQKGQQPINFKMMVASVMAALLFALSSVLMKEIFTEQSFVSGLAWSRLGGLPVILILLAWQENRKFIFERGEMPKGRKLIIFLLARLFSTAGFLLVNLAIALISPALVNALQGVQFGFLFILTIIFSKFYPEILKEEIGRRQIILKVIGILIIIVGTIIVFRS